MVGQHLSKIYFVCINFALYLWDHIMIYSKLGIVKCKSQHSVLFTGNTHWSLSPPQSRGLLEGELWAGKEVWWLAEGQGGDRGRQEDAPGPRLAIFSWWRQVAVRPHLGGQPPSVQAVLRGSRRAARRRQEEACRVRRHLQTLEGEAQQREMGGFFLD